MKWRGVSPSTRNDIAFVLFLIVWVCVVAFLLTSCTAVVPDCATIKASSYLPIDATTMRLIQNGDIVGTVTLEQVYACYTAGAK